MMQTGRITRSGWGIHAVMVVIMCAAITSFASIATAEPLCKESLGEYYVNIGIANGSFGTGLDDAFEVTIRRMRPSSEQDLERLKPFNYFDGKDEKGEAYANGRKYLWQKEGKEYRLFRKVSGRKDVRIDVFAVAFSPANRMKNMMRLMNANRALYTELALDSRLQVLGVMGVAFRGSHGTVEFINTVQADTEPPGMARVSVSNADTMLSRYARAAGYEGADPALAVSDWSGEPAVRTLLRKADEQYLLDNLPDFIQKQGYAKDLDDAMSTFGDITVNGIKAGDIKYIFQKCIPSGVSTYGSPRSAFIPLKVSDGNSSYYPVFVFPSAFSSTDALNAEIWKTALEIRWWNAAANLENTPDDRKRLREAILRYDLPHLKLDSFNRADPYSWSDPGTAEYAVHYSLWSLEQSSLDAAVNKPEAPRAIPWTVNPRLVMPETLGSMVSKTAESTYNTFFAELIPDLGAYLKQEKAPDGKFKKVKKAVAAVKGLGEGIASKISARGDDKVAADLAAVMASGYVITKEERGEALKASLKETAAYFEYLKPWKDIPETERGAALELVDKITKKGLYAFDDLAWLNEMAQNYPLPRKTGKGGKRYIKDIPAGKRMDFLAKKIKSLKNLEKALADPQMISLHRDQKAIEEIVGTALARGEKAVTELESKTDTEVKDRLKKKEAIAAINQELKIVKGALAGAFQVKSEADAVARSAISPKESEYLASYDEMSAACKDDNFLPVPWAADIYGDIATAYSDDQKKLIACIEKANPFIRARQKYRDTVREQNLTVSEKTKAVHELDDKADELFDSMTGMVQLEKQAEMPTDNFSQKTRRALKKALILVKIKDPDEAVTSWKIFARRAFEQYLTATGSEEDAYAALEVHLKKIPGLEIIESK